MNRETDNSNRSSVSNSVFSSNFSYDFLEDIGTFIDVGVNKNSTIALINPRYQGINFGSFTVPDLGNLFCESTDKLRSVLSQWAVISDGTEFRRKAFVPLETGRAILLRRSDWECFPDILIKGTGLVEKYTKKNKLRFSDRGFDGFLELSEGERDLVNSDILFRAGVRVSAGIGVVDHHRVQKYENFTAWLGNYVRAFRIQTRISNLFEMSDFEKKYSIDTAIRRLTREHGWARPPTYAEYFEYMTNILAKNIAIMQAIGFTQDSLHYGQITLCGEVTDLGVGHFRRPLRFGVVNTLHPWFRYERQPALIQNMLFKTHAVKAEPDPVLLPKYSRAIMEQQSLWSAIYSFAPTEAREIAQSQPEKRFWKIYDETYRSFDYARFAREVLNEISTYFDWTPDRIFRSIAREHRRKLEVSYLDALTRLRRHFENQIETWDRRGPTAIHKQILFSRALRSHGVDTKLMTSEPNGFSELNPAPSTYLGENDRNPLEDISWKPKW